MARWFLNADFGMGGIDWDMQEVLERMQSGEISHPELMQVLLRCVAQCACRTPKLISEAA